MTVDDTTSGAGTQPPSEPSVHATPHHEVDHTAEPTDDPLAIRLEQLILGADRRYTPFQAARTAGVSMDLASRFWRAMGFADIGQAKALTEADVLALQPARRSRRGGAAQRADGDPGGPVHRADHRPAGGVADRLVPGGADRAARARNDPYRGHLPAGRAAPAGAPGVPGLRVAAPAGRRHRAGRAGRRRRGDGRPCGWPSASPTSSGSPG